MVSTDLLELEQPLLLVDTCGCDMTEVETEDGAKANFGEAALVSAVVYELIDAGIQEMDIAVITPYNGQVDILRRLLLDTCVV